MPRFPAATPPKTLKIPSVDERHGIRRSDDYAWLRAANWREVFRDPAVLDPVIRTQLDAENTYQATLMAGTEDLRTALLAEMRGRIKEDDSSVPVKDGPFAYGRSFRAGGEHPRYFRTPRDGGAQEIILDGDREAEGKAYFQAAGVIHSPDHRMLLWSLDDNGSEYFQARVRDLATGDDLPDRVGETDGGGAWAADGSGFFYTRLDANHRPSKVLFHRLGTAQELDRLVYEEPDAGFFVSVSTTLTDRFVVITSNDHETSECRIIPADAPEREPFLVEARVPGVEYHLEDGGDRFYILTNDGGAKDFRIVTAPHDAPARANWQDEVPHEAGCLILSLFVFSDHLTRLERRDGLPRIVVRERASGREHGIAFDEEAYALGLAGAAEFDTSIIRFTYSSMTTPSQVFDYDMATRTRTLLKTQEVPSGHDPAAYVTRRVMAKANDGELVPVSLIHRRGLALDGSAPCLLYGYGAYGITIPAGFNTNILSLVDRGFVYAIAHIRGGKDKGYAWYEAGKRERKVNTFDDFIAAARFLARERYTSAGRIVAHGGSAGGMLMGAVANRAPEAFGGIIAEVPFVDVLTTMLDDSLPLTPPEWPEWGNPIASKADYETIAAYSPVDNVRSAEYPPVLAMAGLTDPRVTYWEPAKWVARLRETAVGGPFLLRINMGAGHGGASGRFARLEEVAYAYAFALKVVGRDAAA